MGLISCHITSLVIYGLGVDTYAHAHTHIHIHTQTHTYTSSHIDDMYRIDFKKPGVSAFGKCMPGLKSNRVLFLNKIIVQIHTIGKH